MSGPVINTDSLTWGVDVSDYQGAPDWAAVYAAGYRFACIKSSEATRGTTKTFERNRRDARAAGLIVGAYHFCRPDGDPRDAEIEAEHFARVMGSVADDELPPAVDIESPNAPSAFSGRPLMEWTNAFIARLEELTKRRVLIYTYPYFFAGHGVTPYGVCAERALWVAHYGQYDNGRQPTVPKPWRDYTFWQTHGDDGRVPGVSGACDRDVFRGSLDELRALIVESKHVPHPGHIDPVHAADAWRTEDNARDVLDQLPDT